ncbi:MAG: hypothetical protein M2R45_04703 [Verrucomicrobia subdivision 3 bacterium]|nr:hypothetical protein [Limisphaerales bacterium]MCS1416274.1 hypothetical protein [Limisphaerales bacterium]
MIGHLMLTSVKSLGQGGGVLGLASIRCLGAERTRRSPGFCHRLNRNSSRSLFLFLPPFYMLPHPLFVQKPAVPTQ